MNKINYYNVSQQIIKSFKEGSKKPRLLLHACCGICSIFPLDYLSPYFDITIYYTNSNIYSIEEFNKRFEVLKNYLDLLQKEKNICVSLEKVPYDHEKFMQDLLPYKDSKEGGERCFLCYTKRMAEAYDYAEENKFDYFTTTLTVSRQKDSQVINHIAEKLEKEHFYTKYFYSDFKKHAGGEIGTKKAKDLGLYIQDFCGCEFSLRDSTKE